MHRSFRPITLRIVLVVAALAAAVEAEAIEMFTFFGDGSRIGLPSLEVPVEAYPGIPLRSDRIRMRRGRFGTRRGMPGGAGGGWMAQPRGVAPKVAQPIEEPRDKSTASGGSTDLGGGIRVRPMATPSRTLPIAPMPPE